MNTSQIEKLYIEAAVDFAHMLGQGDRVPYLCFCGDIGIYHCDDGWRGCDVTKVGTDKVQSCDLPAPLAVTVMTESWRQRLEEKHGVCLIRRFCVDPSNHLGNWEMWYRPNDVRIAKGDTLPEAIVAAVKALAAEKRAAKLATPVSVKCSTCGGSLDCHWFPPDSKGVLPRVDVGMCEKCAAEKRQAIAATTCKSQPGEFHVTGHFPDPTKELEKRIRQIVREELENIKREPIPVYTDEEGGIIPNKGAAK